MLQVKIKTPGGPVWEGGANSISSENSEGAFDILPGHANFLTLINNKPITICSPDKKQEFKFDRAVIYVTKDVVSIYTHLLHKR